MTGRHMCEEGAVCPEINTNGVLSRNGEVFARVGKGERGTGAPKADGVDEVTCGQVPSTDDGVG